MNKCLFLFTDLFKNIDDIEFISIQEYNKQSYSSNNNLYLNYNWFQKSKLLLFDNKKDKKLNELPADPTNLSNLDKIYIS